MNRKKQPPHASANEKLEYDLVVPDNRYMNINDPKTLVNNSSSHGSTAAQLTPQEIQQAFSKRGVSHMTFKDFFGSNDDDIYGHSSDYDSEPSKYSPQSMAEEAELQANLEADYRLRRIEQNARMQARDEQFALKMLRAEEAVRAKRPLIDVLPEARPFPYGFMLFRRTMEKEMTSDGQQLVQRIADRDGPAAARAEARVLYHALGSNPLEPTRHFTQQEIASEWTALNDAQKEEWNKLARYYANIEALQRIPPPLPRTPPSPPSPTPQCMSWWCQPRLRNNKKYKGGNYKKTKKAKKSIKTKKSKKTKNQKSQKLKKKQNK